MAGKLRTNNDLVLDWVGVHGNNIDRYGVLRGMDVHMVRTGSMEIVIAILIIAVIIWWPRKRGE